MNKDLAKHVSDGSTILYGVPKVEYGAAGCTPFPMCVKACANYLGQDVSYDYTMAGSGAAFRLTWDTTCWNGGNVDVIFTFDDPVKVYKMGIETLGREFRLLGRTSSTTKRDPAKFSTIQTDVSKVDFMKFIKAQIDRGVPCIALGVIGPCEACIITGYRENGQTLLGWNFFQDNPEFAAVTKFDESGYFITGHWWENQDTVAVMSLSEISGQRISAKEIIKNAIEVMKGRQLGDYAKGLFAYDAWKKAIADDTQFPENAILPILAERLMCQGDAMDCLADGRRNAAVYMRKLGEELPDQKQICKSAEEGFSKVEACIWKMAKALGGYARNELQMRNLGKKEVRRQLAMLIDEAHTADEKAFEAMNALYDAL